VQAGKPAIGGSLAGNIFHGFRGVAPFPALGKLPRAAGWQQPALPDIRELYWGA